MSLDTGKPSKYPQNGFSNLVTPRNSNFNMIILLRFETTTWGFRHTLTEYTPSENEEDAQNSSKSAKTVDFALAADFCEPQFSVSSTDSPGCCLISITYP